jgi:6-pyruvoyl-tetrahydropterin synthase
VCDFGELAGVGDWIKETLDHKHLNDVVSEPTCENLAAAIFFGGIRFS